MGRDVEFSIDGLDELQRDFNAVVEKYPDEAEKETFKQVGRFTKDVNAKFPASYKKGKRPLSKSWKRERVRTFSGYTVEVTGTNTAPHWHLVENGHELWIPPERYAAMMAGKLTYTGQIHRGKRRRKEKGDLMHVKFVPGKHYCELTRKEWQKKYPQTVMTFVDEMLKKNNL